MAQKGLMKILSRKNGKGMISENEGNDKIKVTKVLEFVTARRPEDVVTQGDPSTQAWSLASVHSTAEQATSMD